VTAAIQKLCVCGIIALSAGCASSGPSSESLGSVNGSGHSGSHGGGTGSGDNFGSGSAGGGNNSGSSTGDTTGSGGPTAGSTSGGTGTSPGGDDGGGSPGGGDGGGGGGGGGPGGGDGSSGSSGEGGTSPSGCWPPVTGDYTADGPYKAMTTDNTSVMCTIIQPTTLAANGCLNPLIVWGNGTVNTPSTYAALFSHWATHGFIIAAADTSNAGSGKEMLACLQYMLDQNKMSGGPFYNHIDTGNIAVSGYSQGGAGCLEAGEDPRFKVLAPVSPYIVLSLGGYDTSAIMKQVHPMFMISGSADSVAVPSNNQQPIFSTSMVPIFWGTHAGSTHFEVLGAGGAYAGPLTAWFRYQLMGDTDARDWFEKPACKLCSATGWTVQTNSLWK